MIGTSVPQMDPESSFLRQLAPRQSPSWIAASGEAQLLLAVPVLGMCSSWLKLTVGEFTDLGSFFCYFCCFSLLRLFVPTRILITQWSGPDSAVRHRSGHRAAAGLHLNGAALPVMGGQMVPPGGGGSGSTIRQWPCIDTHQSVCRNIMISGVGGQSDWWLGSFIAGICQIFHICTSEFSGFLDTGTGYCMYRHLRASDHRSNGKFPRTIHDRLPRLEFPIVSCIFKPPLLESQSNPLHRKPDLPDLGLLHWIIGLYTPTEVSSPLL